MKKKSNWRTILATLIMVLPFVLGLGSMTDVMAATEVPAKQKVTIHKRQFDTMPSDKENTGDVMPNFGGEPLAGAIFEAYDVTSTYWAAYDGTDGTDADKTKAAEDAVKALKVEDLTAVATFGPTDSKGEASQELATKSGGRNAIYLFHETTSPAGVVQSKSVDFILGLPVYDEDTDNAKTDVHVYPKNETEDLTFEFKKYGVEPGDKVGQPLAGAKFILKDKLTGKYYDEETGKFTADETTASKIISGDDGLVTVKGLVLNPGSYEFYEVDSTVSTSQEQGIDTKEIFHYAKNPMVIVKVSPDMEVSYIYYDINGNKVTNASSDAKAYNYKVPAPTKEADDHDVDTNQVFNFEITQLIPTDIADYTTFALVDTFDPNLQLVNATEADLLAEIKASMSEEMAGLVSGVTLDTENNTFTVNFNLDKVKANAGKTISFKVQMSVKDGATLDKGINNEVTFDNNFDDQSAKDSVRTYGKSFLKVDADNSGKTLAGAEFHVLNPEGKLLGTIGTGADKKQVWGTEGDEGFTPLVVTSDDHGRFSVSGLAKTDADGNLITYQLKEIKAPDGYALANDPFDFTADNGSAALQSPIVNKHKGSLPSTGGKGIVAFVAVGVVAIAGAGLYFMKGRKHIEG